MTVNSIPNAGHPIAGGQRVDPTWYKWLRELDREARDTGTDLSAEIEAIARKLGSPDGTIDGIPESAQSLTALPPLAISGNQITLSTLTANTAGELFGISRDAYGRISALRPVVAGVGIEIDGTTDPNEIAIVNTGLTNPMTTLGDLIRSDTGGVPERLPVGTNGQVLTVVSGEPSWATSTALVNPMTTAGDIITGGAAGAPQRLGIGSSGQVLSVVSGAPAWTAAPASGVDVQDEGSTVVSGATTINFVGSSVTATSGGGGVATVTISGGGGLAQFTEARNTAAPNATVPVHSLTASGTETNIDAVFASKGIGALARTVSNNLASGGNKRGASSADLQSVRSSADQVASGVESFIGAGRDNTASGSNSAVIAGRIGTASATNAVVIGGQSGTASGARSICLGGSFGIASGNDSFSFGGGNAGATSAVAIGVGANSNAVVGAFSETSGSGPPRSRYTLHRSSTDATPVVLTTNGAAPADTNQVYFGNLNNRSGIYRGLVVARQTGTGGGAKSWEFVAHLNRSGGTLSLVAAVTPTVVADSGVGWSIAVTADDTLKTLRVAATGAAATTIRWACHVWGQEVDGT